MMSAGFELGSTGWYKDKWTTFKSPAFRPMLAFNQSHASFRRGVNRSRWCCCLSARCTTYLLAFVKVGELNLLF